MAKSTASALLDINGFAIPIKFYLTAKAESVSFKRITPKGNTTNQQTIDSVTGQVYPLSVMRKGYEYEKGKIVVFTEEEVNAMQPTKTDRVDVQEFVPLDSVNPFQVEKSYWLQPGKGADRSYAILAETLRRENKAAVASWITRGKTQLLVIRYHNGGLAAHQMYYNTEMRAFDTPTSKFEITEKQLNLTKLIVDSLSEDEFDPSKYSDPFPARVADAAARKLNGEAVVVPADEDAPVLGVDAALEAAAKAVAGKKKGAKVRPEAPAKGGAAKARAKASAKAKQIKKKAPAKKKARR